MTEVIVAVISGALSLIGVIFTVAFGNKQTQKSVKEQTDLTMYRIKQLEEKQDKHNTLIERMYKCEEKIALLEEGQKVENHRISDLEAWQSRGGNPPSTCA